MKRIWGWMQENSSALQGAAAFVIVIGAFIAFTSYLMQALSPDLVVRVNVDNSTVPPDLIEFTEDISRLFIWDSEVFAEVEGENTKLEALLNNPILKRIESTHGEIDKARIELINQSEIVVSGVRLRLDNIFSLWGFDISGTFLQNHEAESFKAKLKGGGKGASIVLPELPAIPPNSSLELTLYGNLDLLEPVITVAGHSYLITEIVEVEYGLLIDWYQNPYKLVAILPMVLLLIYILFVIAWSKVRRSIKKSETKSILYDKACELAIAGNPDDAMVLLQQAVISGYSNKKHALKDDDLESLREREDFIELFRKT